MWLNPWVLGAGLIFQLTACWWEERSQQPPGQRLDIGGCKLHLYALGVADRGSPTVVCEHSLGGIDGYFLVDEIAKFSPVCIYDRAGYGWSESSWRSRSSEQIVQEMDALLTAANISPPYILVGDSFGSYNVRLYTHRFPDRVSGLVLVDGLHEQGMLEMSLGLRVLKLFFASGFVMSTFGAAIGIVRLLGLLGIFELLKPDLRKFPQAVLSRVKRSFYRPKHWMTMCREILTLDVSSRQLRTARLPVDLPIISIKSATFFKQSAWNFYMPIGAANDLRERMHERLLKLSTNCTQMQADWSSHFVWIEQPKVILDAIKEILAMTTES
jgi:pimeloyl-ACP methyl ester carboxylesterase